MSKKFVKSKKSASRGPKLGGKQILAGLGLLVVVSLLLAPLLPSILVEQSPPTATIVLATAVYNLPTETPTATPTSAAPASPTPGRALAPTSP